MRELASRLHILNQVSVRLSRRLAAFDQPRTRCRCSLIHERYSATALIWGYAIHSRDFATLSLAAPRRLRPYAIITEVSTTPMACGLRRLHNAHIRRQAPRQGPHGRQHQGPRRRYRAAALPIANCPAAPE